MNLRTIVVKDGKKFVRRPQTKEERLVECQNNLPGLHTNRGKRLLDVEKLEKRLASAKDDVSDYDREIVELEKEIKELSA